MAFVVLSGCPSSGKTTLALKLRQDFLARMADESYTGPSWEVVIVEDDIGVLGRTVYSESRLEKPVRASLLSEVTRSLSKRTIVICDGLNYIKGYRYQMNCAAKEAGVRACTIHVATPPEKCKEFNRTRAPTEAYTEETMDALLMRFEEPSSMARWDSPLFTVGWDDPSPPFDDIWLAMTSAVKKKANPSVVPNGQTATDTIQTLHSATSTLISHLLSHLSLSPLSPHLKLPSPPYPPSGLNLPQRTITLSELQRLKRQFEGIQMNGFKRGGEGVKRAGWGEKEWAEAWVRFLEVQWGVNEEEG
ncbi:chromatin associated protein KTI12 [Mrakia frigida]|uniref:Kti12p n=1 Tax=Mrakia frigida TaxID=29902 RepID=UPI003FCC196A